MSDLCYKIGHDFGWRGICERCGWSSQAAKDAQLVIEQRAEIERLRALVVERWTHEHQGTLDQILQDHIDRVQSERDESREAFARCHHNYLVLQMKASHGCCDSLCADCEETIRTWESR